MTKPKLTSAQRRRLLVIADYRGTPSLPHIGFWPGSKTDQALERAGLIERYDHQSRFVGALAATFPLARLTPEGVLTAEEIRPK